MRGRRGGERGFALPTVLWVLMVLAAVAASQTETSRLAVETAVARGEIAAAKAAAEAGLPIALLAIDAAVRDRRPAPRGVACRFAGARLAIAIEDEAGKIDLNRVSPETLAAVFGALGLGPGEAAALAGDLVRYREASPTGSADAATAGKGAPLEVLGELARLPGGGALDLARAGRHLTTIGAPRVDPDAASKLVLDVVRTLGAEARGLGPSPQRAFTVRVAAETPGARYAFAAVVEIGRPVLATARIVERFRSVAGPALPAPSETRLPPC